MASSRSQRAGEGAAFPEPVSLEDLSNYYRPASCYSPQGHLRPDVSQLPSLGAQNVGSGHALTGSGVEGREAGALGSSF